MGTGEMAQPLKVLTALVEDPSLVPNTYVIYLSSSKGHGAFFCPLAPAHTCTYPCRHVLHMLSKSNNKSLHCQERASGGGARL